MHLACDDYLKLSSIEAFSSPFDYFTSPEAFQPEVAALILDWLELRAPWKLVIADFYEQYEFSFWNVELPSELVFLTQARLVTTLRERLQKIFNVRLSRKVDIAAHKLIPGQRIRLHNDFIAGHETHRLLIQLNRRWTDDHGGLLMLFNSPEPSDIHKIFRPLHNTALAFAVSPQSNHAVSKITAEHRFTLVYSFFAENTDA
jgi:Rps23 Pro-64 3,4-dihydroxylase Tpa1-like proline 4-hydroxylase